MDPTQQPLQTPVQIPDFQPKSNYLKTVIFFVLAIVTLGLIAYLIFQNQKLQKQVLNPQISPTIQIPSPTSKPSSSISIPTDETVNWKTYINTKYNFTFKYPNNWFLENRNDQEFNFFQEGTIPNPTKMGSMGNEIFRMVIDNTLFNNDSIPKLQEITVGGRPALRDAIEVKILINNDVINWTILLEIRGSRKYIDQILSTFKFTNDTSVCIPTYQVETNSTELTAKQNYSMRCTEQRSEKDCLSIDLYNQKTDDFSIPDKIPDCIWKNPTK